MISRRTGSTTAMGRRDVLKAGLLSAAVSLLPRWKQMARAAEQSGLTLGFSLYGMRRLPILDALELCAQIGYQAIELPVMVDWAADPQGLTPEARQEIRERLTALNLQLPALMENLSLEVDAMVREAQIDRLDTAAALGQDLSPDQPPLIETIIGGRGGQWTELRHQFVDALGKWVELATRIQTVICVKPHRLGALNQPEDAVWLMEQLDSPWLKLVYDYSHFQHREMTIRDTLAALLPHTRFVHLKDTVIENGQPRFVLPGDGGVNYEELFAGLRAGGYRGCVCVEVSGMVQSRPDYNPQAAARRSYENLAPCSVLKMPSPIRKCAREDSNLRPTV